MARLERATPHGRFEVRGRSDLIEAACDLAQRDHEQNGAGVERIEFAGHGAWFKRSLLHGKSRWRWACKRAFGAQLPRVREYENSLWLADHGFRTPAALAAGVLVRAGIPLRQFMLTEDVAGATTLAAFMSATSGADRRSVLDELARETARLHALGFVHHDLYPRNVLVRAASEPRRIVFLDAWAGGPAPQLRTAAYDVACLFLRAERDFTPEDVQRFLDLYANESAAQGKHVDAVRLLARAKRERRRLVRRLIARPHELRGEPAPKLDW